MNFYKLTGCIHWFLNFLTSFDEDDLQFTVNNWDFEFLKELVVMCLQNAHTNEKSQWTFLSNGKHLISAINSILRFSL